MHRLVHTLDQKTTLRSATRLCAGILIACGLIGCDDDGQGTVDTPTTTCRTDLELGGFALNQSYCAVADLELSEADTQSVALGGSALLSFHQSTVAEDDRKVVFAVQRRAISFADGSLGDAEPLWQFDMTLEGKEQLFGGHYLARSPGGTLAVGYTRQSDTGGSVMYGDEADSGAELVAPGNFDAVWLDDDTLLVHGTGLGDADEGAGVYVWRRGENPRKLVDGLGDSSSYLAAGTDVIYIGEVDWPINRVYAFTREELSQAIDTDETLAKAAGDMVYDGPAADVSTIGSDLVVLDISFDAGKATFNGVHRIGVAVDEASVSTTGSADLAVPVEAGGAVPGQLAGDGQLLGLVRPSDSGKIVTVVRLK